MLSPDQLLGFLLAAVAVTASPGPDNLMVLGIGVSRGRRHGIAFGLGCALGCLSHTLLAVAGVSALVAASPVALSTLKIAGGTYLVWLGIKSLRSQGQLAVDAGAAETGAAGLRALFAQGLLANAINPKVILFFLAFLPQFVRVGQGPVAWQMTALGLAFTAQAALLFGLLGYFAGSVGQWLQRWPRAGLWLDRVAGLVFIGLGARLILAL